MHTRLLELSESLDSLLEFKGLHPGQVLVEKGFGRRRIKVPSWYKKGYRIKGKDGKIISPRVRDYLGGGRINTFTGERIRRDPKEAAKLIGRRVGKHVGKHKVAYTGLAGIGAGAYVNRPRKDD